MDLITTTHKLAFEVGPWKYDYLQPELNLQLFRVGTCGGLWGWDEESIFILAIDNKVPGNGHFEDVLEWFYFSCKRHKKSLKFLEFFNERFYNHLIKKRGFVDAGKTDTGVTVIKYF